MRDTGGNPVAGATVALLEKNGKVMAWTQTDAQGRYALAVDPLEVLRLRPSRQRGLLSRIAGGVGAVVAAPVKLAGAAAQGVSKAARETVTEGASKTAKTAVASAITGSPAPVAAQVVQDTLLATKSKIETKAREEAAKTVAGEGLPSPQERQAPPEEQQKTLPPGEITIKVSAPKYQDATGPAGAYWMEQPATVEGKSIGPQAWIETVRLAPEGNDQKSGVENESLLLADARIEPTMAPSGGRVKLRVTLRAPEEVTPKVRVFAREDRTRTVVELQLGEENVFSGELGLDPKTPKGPTTVTIVALRAEPVEVKLPREKSDPLREFVEHLDDLDPDRPYEFDPRIMASENRIDLSLTVLDPKASTPPAGSSSTPR